MSEKTVPQNLLEKRIKELLRDRICYDATPMDFLTILSKKYMMDYTDDFKHYRIHAARSLAAVSEVLESMKNEGVLEERAEGIERHYRLMLRKS